MDGMTAGPRKRRDGGAYRALWAFDREDYEAHLLRLTPEDRRSRFQYPATDAQIAAHVAEFINGGGHVIGWFSDGVLRGAAEVMIFPDQTTAEAAFEVEAEWRGIGVGVELVSRSLLWARNRGVRKLLIHTTRRNTAMLKAAKQSGAVFEFDLSDAEGVIDAPKPSWRSHLAEAKFEEQGLYRWFRDAARHRLAQFWPWHRRDSGEPVAAQTGAKTSSH
jgi:GNAT superfamily N-acetyltransferase